LLTSPGARSVGADQTRALPGQRRAGGETAGDGGLAGAGHADQQDGAPRGGLDRAEAEPRLQRQREIGRGLSPA
jgi:hypothetical protein